ncbi:ABC transporter substrate-binding protein [Qiania dongpingensis]|uniref:Carbohydrate ABC transporter substrate-binding protein n=1 Tax=Qiania dongpingensis TaxID=2763669 RepID=A0A7G9G749_9FIRM|nr:ABC transporter substrate-binding protein [Qiania dongpingensis]QNM06631.1 carbohydrate ABC transporter substrate-binding protein [Qiania dongpingensis]
MKRYIWIVVLVISVLNICGCGLDKPKEKDTLPLETSSLESFEKDSKTEEQSSEKFDMEQDIEPGTLTWAVFDMGTDLEIYEDSLNELLRNKGIENKIKFVDIKVPFEEDYEAYVQTYIDAVQTGGYDIVTCPGVLNCYDVYAIMAQKGMLEPLDIEPDQTENGTELQRAYPAVVWKSLRYEGEIYGVLTPYTNFKYYAVFNQKYAQEFGLDVERVSFSDMENLMEKVIDSGIKKENPAFVISTMWPYFLSASYENTICELLAVSVGDGAPVVENILKNEEFLDHMELLNRWGEKGMICYDNYWEALGAGEFFVTGIYSYSAESAEMYCRNAYEMDESIQLLAVELPEFNQSFSGKGNKACVLEGSKNKEEAIHILSLIYSEKDFSDALAGSAFGNPFLTSPGEGESESINKELWDTVETIHPSELNGFFFDMTEIGMTVSEVNTLIQDDYMWKFSGNSEDWKAELKKIEETLERMGIQEVVDNMNQQLNTKN